MSKDIVLWDGSVVTVTDEQASRLSAGQYGREQTTSEGLGQGAAATLDEQSGIDTKVRAFTEGALDAASFGLYGRAMMELGDDEGRFEMQRSGQAAPLSRLGGEITGTLLPGAGTLARGAGAALGGGSKLVGRTVEGALMGAAGTVAHSNVTGDPLSVEGLVEGAGIGGVLNVGAGVLGDAFTGAGRRARKAIDEAETLARDTEIASSNARHFDTNSGVSTAYRHFEDAVKVQQKVSNQAVRQWERQNDLYQSFAGNNHRLSRAIEDAENTVRSVKQRYAESTPFDVSDVAAGTKPPISAELDARLKEYQARVSRLYQLKGGRTRISPQKWDTATGEVDREALMGELRSLYTDLQRDFPKAAGKLKPLPAPMGPRPEPFSAELAGSFKRFINQRPETVERLAVSLGDAGAEFNRVAEELGVAVGATPAETMRSVHAAGREWQRAMRAAEEGAAKEAGEVSSGRGFFALARRFARNSLGFRAGHHATNAVGGGMLGTAVGALTSAGVRAGLERAEMGLVGGTLLAAKDAAESRIRQVVARWGAPVGAGTQRLGPVSAYLSNRLTGEREGDEHDVRTLARRRADEIHGMAGAAPDTAFAAVEALLGHPSDVAFKVHQHVVNALNHLASTLPRDPGLDIKMFESKWTPSWHETMNLAHRLEAVQAPLASLARLMSGEGSPAAADTLWAVWPAMMSRAAQEVVEKAVQGEYSTERASAFSQLFRVPLTGFQNPIVLATIQGMYLPPAPQQGSSPAQPTGRPPRVQSPVAGSSVAGLIQ